MADTSTEQRNGADPVYPFQELDAQGMPRSAACVGLTKRELFAAMAMQGYCVHAAENDFDLSEVAADAVAQADALLAALEHVVRLKRRPFLTRFWRSYRGWRKFVGTWRALRGAWTIARVAR